MKVKIAILVLVLLLSISTIAAVTLTDSQIQALTSLITSSGADQSVIQKVGSYLRGETPTSPADISQDDATFLDSGLLDDPLDELLNEGEADIPIDDIETDDPALLNQQSAATPIAYSPNASQVGAVVAAGESGWRDDQEDTKRQKTDSGAFGHVKKGWMSL